jgi:hypothetical protein
LKLQKILTTNADEDHRGQSDDDDNNIVTDEEEWLKAINKCIQKVSAGKPERLLHRMQTVSPEDVEIYSQEGNQHLILDGEHLVDESMDMWNIAQ